ncbi:FadR/GntR family transcriptional regulator [Mycolicibacterium moriokaense]|uniref:GntR family transcriptional regulator n=1 Tax=Mycolicibacterium moriokaense TaxID=39691 RepID=A0A318HBD5_9MYCO|nr:FCD domain-containing protein [Mycolicibacterium moriokaense]PXW99851.1 GntR family transcriptional regulator [Mycolicibacterium moriokaense]
MPHEAARRQGSGRPPGTTVSARTPDLAVPPPRTRAEQLAAGLDARIREQDLQTGDSVGTFESLRAETGFAYSTVSEAVRLLRDRGVLEVRPGRGGGLFVADRLPIVRLRHTLLAAPEPAAVADAIELRDHLEVLIDVAAARFHTDADIADLRVHLDRMGSAPNWDAFVRANWALHERIAAIGPNALARAVYLSTLGPLRATSTRFDDERAVAGYRAERHRIHVDLVDSIAAGNESRVRKLVARHNHGDREV